MNLWRKSAVFKDLFPRNYLSHLMAHYLTNTSQTPHVTSQIPHKHLTITSQSPHNHLTHYSQTPHKHHTDTCYLTNTSQTPHRHLKNTSQTPHKHLTNTSQTPHKHLTNTTCYLTDTPRYLTVQCFGSVTNSKTGEVLELCKVRKHSL